MSGAGDNEPQEIVKPADDITKPEQQLMTEADSTAAIEGKEIEERKDHGKAMEGAGNDDEDEEKKEEDNIVVVSTSRVEEEEEEEEDGFKTPTSSDHKIQPITQCPPAPKKARPQPSKRKASSLSPRRGLQLDDSTEVESIFRPASSQEVDSVEEDKQENKRARREDGED